MISTSYYFWRRQVRQTANRPESRKIPFQGMQSKARQVHVGDLGCLFQTRQDALQLVRMVRPHLPPVPSLEQMLETLVAEVSYHMCRVTSQLSFSRRHTSAPPPKSSTDRRPGTRPTPSATQHLAVLHGALPRGGVAPQHVGGGRAQLK